MKPKEVIPGGWVTLLDSMGDDLDIVNSARISFNKKHEVFEEGDAKLIDFLLRNRHGTPFEMVEFKFQIRCPLTVAREWFRHRIASYNEISGRYVKQTSECYVPKMEDVRTQKGKPGNYYFEILDEEVAYQAIQLMMRSYEEAYEIYENLLNIGVAKELARNVLPQGMFTEFVFKTNARSLMNFLSLRNDERAMLEIRRYAEEMENDFRKVVPVTYESFVKHGRMAP
jgi:thymidylate synthase (FAD)